MPRTNWGWQITPDELESWIVHEDTETLAVNKPAHVVCHPSKHGPWSSLVSAVRERLRLDRVHLPSRLDRETSGVVVFAKNPKTASKLQTAIARGEVSKTYFAILTGELQSARTVDAPVGREYSEIFSCRQWVLPDSGKAAVTDFEPIAVNAGLTLARVVPRTGRMHQIRVHAAYMGYPLVGDKLYGPDPRLMIEFLEHGFNERLQQLLLIDRQALHASEIMFSSGGSYCAPMTEDLATFARARGLQI